MKVPIDLRGSASRPRATTGWLDGRHRFGFRGHHAPCDPHRRFAPGGADLVWATA